MPDLFKDLGIKHKGILSLSPRDTFQLLQKGAFLLDMRITDYSDYKAFDAENVLNMPPENFEERIKTLDPEGFYILADSSGINSQHYAGKMLGLGFRHVASLSGGFVEWERDGLPVSVDINERLSGSCACQLKPRERK
jgi:rhodanese-related sulfurtransferase